MALEEELQKAKSIFDRVLELTPDRQPAFLDAACGADPVLRQKVEFMMREFESTAGSDSPWIKPAESQHASEPAVEFRGTLRFAVQRQLGAGAFGTVYQVWDREQQVTAAVKVLHSRKPDQLFRFKREFRALVDLRHRNLVRLYELFSDREQWFFSMELVQGSNFLDYVRPEGGISCDFARLRSALQQLVTGILALHGSRQLHRDLKPANVMVTDAGRVVLLDFGLVREFDSAGSAQTQTQLVGTPAYMAPEQVLDGTVSEASDWYALGVMLFQALTGKLPHSQSVVERLSKGANQLVKEARQFDPEVPADLNDLARRLLRWSPEDRPDGAAILGALGATDTSREAKEDVLDPHNEPEHFVGRSAQLLQLDEAFAETQEGRFNVVLMHGRSGIGKTALVRRFLSLLAERHNNLIVLKGRCYEFESVPYKGLDALIDELSRYLQRLPESRADGLLPRDAFLLTKLFPVLGRVTAIANAPVRSAAVPDAQELRQRTFAALRELLARLSDRHSVVLWIDDLQWGDRDSSTFLAELCTPPNQPSLLMLLTYRSEEVAANATLQYLHQILIDQPVLGNWRQIVLDQLSEPESRQLLDDLLTAQRTAVNDDAQSKIMKEANGHPLFLQQLARFASSREQGLSLEKDLELRTVLQQRIAQLPPFGREVLEYICIANQPLTRSILFAAADSDETSERADTVALLIREKFARTSMSSGGQRIGPYHDQIRTAVAEYLPGERRKTRHARLAAVLASQPDVEPQMLVTHYQEAGDLEAARNAALEAAALAEGQLAFERAAVFYQAAVATGTVERSREMEIYCKLADMLGKAGRGRDSAHIYLRASERPTAHNPVDLQRMAADQLMRSGYIDEAMALFEKLARQVGIPTVGSPRHAVRGMIVNRIRTRLRMMRGIPAIRTHPASGEDMTLLELLRTAGVILNLADPVLATYFETRYVLEALRVRDPLHLSIALCVEASIRVAAGHGNVKRALQLLDKADQIAESTGRPTCVGLCYTLRTYVDYLLARVPDGLAHGRRANQFLREHCTEVGWELTASYVLLFWFISWSGNISENRDLLPQLFTEGAARGDVNVEVSIRLLSYTHYPYLSLDQPQDCIRECQKALGRWSHRGYHLQHYGGMFGLVESYLYLRDYVEAHRLFRQDWKVMSRSFILRWQTLRLMAFFLGGRVALACWLDNPRDMGLRAEIEYYAKRLKGIRSHWCKPMLGVLDAGLLAGSGRKDAASLRLEEAAEAFEQISLHGYASAARHFAGRLRAGERGRALVEAADKYLQTHGVVDGAAFLGMFLPGNWLQENARKSNPSGEILKTIT